MPPFVLQAVLCKKELWYREVKRDVEESIEKKRVRKDKAIYPCHLRKHKNSIYDTDGVSCKFCCMAVLKSPAVSDRFCHDPLCGTAVWRHSRMELRTIGFLYGISVISHAISMIFFVQGWFMGHYVVMGEFDRFMLRPMSVLYQFFFTQINLIGITDLIPGLCVLFYGCRQIQFTWSVTSTLSLLILIIGATLIRGGIYIMMGTVTFWTKSVSDFAGFTQEFFDKTTMYPLSIYPRLMQLILTYLIPIGWISYYPAKDLLHGINQGVFITLIIGILVMTIAGIFFKTGLRNYESAGQ